MRSFVARLAAVAALLFVFAAPGHACGPAMPYAAFAHETHPDLPLQPFAAGHLGVIAPGWARSYLCVAYRWLDGAPFDADEQAALVVTWLARDDSGWYPDGSDEPWVDAWRAERAKVPHVPLPAAHRVEELPSSDLVTELHGPEDAFRTATRALADRIRERGAASPGVRAWLLAQDTVFAACSGNAVGLTLHAPGAVTAERAYQEAAYQMYAGETADAMARFAAIARGPDAQLRPLARYLVARGAVRAAEFEPDGDTGIAPPPVEAAALAQADSVIGAAMADSAVVRAGLLPALHRLRGYVRFRSQPVRRMGELAGMVMRPRSAVTIGQDLWDLAWLMDRTLGEWPVGNAADSTLRLRLRERAGADDLTDWVMTLQGLRDGGPFPASYMDQAVDAAKDPRMVWWRAHRGGSYAHAFARWRERGTPAWLVAALLAAGPQSAGVDTLLAEGARVPPASPAYATVAARRAELLAARGDLAGARAACEAALASPHLPLSAANRLRAARMSAATGAADLFAWAVRTTAAVVVGQDGVHPFDPAHQDEYPDSMYMRPFALVHRPECFDEDGTRVINTRLPLARWREAAAGDALPLRLRRQLALAGWLRAVLAGQDEEARAFAPLLATLHPELAADLRAWSDAAAPDAHAFAAAFLVARRPGAQPFLQPGAGRLPALDRFDDYRDNWWCSIQAPAPGQIVEWTPGNAIAGTQGPGPASVLPGAYPTAADTTSAGGETRALARVPGAPAWFSPTILAWAKAHPDDPRVPEALHRVVRGVRLGCGEGPRAPYGRDAFRILHGRYPSNTWTRRTTTWSW